MQFQREPLRSNLDQQKHMLLRPPRACDHRPQIFPKTEPKHLRRPNLPRLRAEMRAPAKMPDDDVHRGNKAGPEKVHTRRVENHADPNRIDPAPGLHNCNQIQIQIHRSHHKPNPKVFRQHKPFRSHISNLFPETCKSEKNTPPPSTDPKFEPLGLSIAHLSEDDLFCIKGQNPQQRVHVLLVSLAQGRGETSCKL